MMRLEKANKHAHSIRSRIFVFVLISLAAISGCGRQEETSQTPPQKEEPAATNSYMVENVFESVLRKTMDDPENGDAWYHLADLYFRANEYEKAIEAYQKTVALQPDKGYAYGKMGTSLSRLDRPEEAAVALEKAVELLPNPAVEYNNLGIVYGKLGRYEDEINALEKALELRPRYVSARLNLAVIHLKQGNVAAARTQYDTLKDIDQRAADLLLKEINKVEPSSPDSKQ